MAGSDWLSANRKELSDFGARVADLVGALYDGIYHIQHEVLKADWTGQRSVRLCVPDHNFATYDSSLLTHLVLLCHERNIRVQVKAAAHGFLWLDFMPVDRTGFFADQHPTLKDALKHFSVTGAHLDDLAHAAGLDAASRHVANLAQRIKKDGPLHSETWQTVEAIAGDLRMQADNVRNNA